MKTALCDAIIFAQECSAYGFKPAEFAELIRLSRRAISAGVRECNDPRGDSTKAQRSVELMAASLGLSCRWPSLIPEFRSPANQLIRTPFLD